jgi:hypothetical protein
MPPEGSQTELTAALQSIAQAILQSKNVSVDANGWTKIDNGTSIEWIKTANYYSTWSAPAGQTQLYNTLLPVGETDFRKLNVQVTLSTPNASILLGGYIGGATPDFGTISVYAYNVGGATSLAYWHAFIRVIKSI